MEKLIYRFRFCKMSNGITLHVMRTPKNAAVTKHEDIVKWHRNRTSLLRSGWGKL